MIPRFTYPFLQRTFQHSGLPLFLGTTSKPSYGGASWHLGHFLLPKYHHHQICLIVVGTIKLWLEIWGNHFGLGRKLEYLRETPKANQTPNSGNTNIYLSFLPENASKHWACLIFGKHHYLQANLPMMKLLTSWQLPHHKTSSPSYLSYCFWYHQVVSGILGQPFRCQPYPALGGLQVCSEKWDLSHKWPSCWWPGQVLIEQHMLCTVGEREGIFSLPWQSDWN